MKAEKDKEIIYLTLPLHHLLTVRCQPSDPDGLHFCHAESPVPSRSPS